MGLMEEIWNDVVMTVIVLVGALLIRAVLRHVIKKVVAALVARGGHERQDVGAVARSVLIKASGLDDERNRQRVETLGSLMRNIVDVVLVVVVLLTILSIFGVPTAPLLASAGIGGVAIGFGAQSLVKDYLSGIFMLAEDQFGVGDIIQVNGLRGTVQEVTLRITKMREPGGTVWYVRNGEVLSLGNESQGFATAFIDVPVAIDEDPQHVQSILRSALATVGEEPEWQEIFLDGPSVLGVDSMSEGTMVIKVWIKTLPDQQWSATREVRGRAQRALTEAGVRGPILPGIGRSQPAAG